jgi:hypothetical protein
MDRHRSASARAASTADSTGLYLDDVNERCSHRGAGQAVDVHAEKRQDEEDS